MANEKRLVDADALCEFFQNRYNYLRNASRRHLKDGRVFVDREIETGAIIAKEFLDKTKQAPTVDAVEVVRCKNCKSCEQYVVTADGRWISVEKDGEYLYCVKTHRSSVGAEHFCSYGERRE